MLPKYCEAYHWGLFVMPVTVTLLAPCQKHVMNLMALFNVRKASKAGNAMNTFITLTRAIKFITGFWLGDNKVTDAGIKTCTYLYLSAIMGQFDFDCLRWIILDWVTPMYINSFQLWGKSLGSCKRYRLRCLWLWSCWLLVRNLQWIWWFMSM